MYTITFLATALCNTDAVYVPHHSTRDVIERSHGMLVEYSELQRHYQLHIPNCPVAINAEDDPELVAIDAPPWAQFRPYLLAFLNRNHIPYEADHDAVNENIHQHLHM